MKYFYGKNQDYRIDEKVVVNYKGIKAILRIRGLAGKSSYDFEFKQLSNVSYKFIKLANDTEIKLLGRKHSYFFGDKKACYNCKEIKDLSEFKKATTECKICSKERYTLEKEREFQRILKRPVMNNNFKFVNKVVSYENIKNTQFAKRKELD